MSPKENEPDPRNPTAGQLDKEEAWLWRSALLFLIFLAVALAAVAWERLQSLPIYLWIFPVAVILVVMMFAGFAYGRRKRVIELKALVRSVEERAAPSAEQIDQLSQAIARSQRSFKELIDSLDDAAFAVSLDGTLRTVNKRVTQFLGATYQEIVGHKIHEFLEEPTKEQVQPYLPPFLERRRWSGILKLRVKNAPRALYFDCEINAIVNDDEVVGISVLARDVTDEREKEKRFTELFETLQEGVYFSTPEGKLLDANDSLIRMLGYSNKEELVAQDAASLNFEPGQGPILGRRPNDQGSVRTREITLKRKDGRAAMFLDTSRAVWDDSGKIIRYQGTLVDVTERVEMEKELRRQEEFQRYLLESFPDLILVIDLNESFSFVSSRIRDLLGHKPEDLVGKKIGELPDHSSAFAALYRDVSSGRRLFGFCEYEANHRDGSLRTMRASASPLFDAESKVKAWMKSHQLTTGYLMGAQE